jgi:hypothetical protein
MVPPAAPVVVPVPVVVRPLTFAEFASVFRPIPGTHEVLLIHPGSGRVAAVRFTLPPGCPKVRVHKREIEFDYGRCQVEIRGALFGKFKVNYN